MFSATCSQCGKDCQVPFRPSGEKPVYCSDCYEKLGNNSNSWSYGDNRPQQRSSFGNRSYGSDRNFTRPTTDNRQMEMVAKKLDRIIELLEGQRPAVKMVEKVVEKKIDKKPVVKAKKKTKKVAKK